MLYYKAEHAAIKGTTKTMSKIIGIMIALVIAVICYSVTVYAWFQADVINTGNTIQAAEYGIEVSSVLLDNQPVSSTADGSYPLKDSQTYEITLTATGTADTGYCLIKCGQEEWKVTSPIIPGSRFHFTYTPAEDGGYTFIGMWGSYSGDLDVITDVEIGKKAENTEAPIKRPESQEITSAPSEQSTSSITSGNSEQEGTAAPEQPVDGEPGQGTTVSADTTATPPTSSEAGAESSSAADSEKTAESETSKPAESNPEEATESTNSAASTSSEWVPSSDDVTSSTAGSETESVTGSEEALISVVSDFAEGGECQ